MSLPANKPEQVKEYMIKLNHPLKAEIKEIRKVIKKINKYITEEIKWNAPSFGYKNEYLVTFNLRATEHIHNAYSTTRI